jgi:hypothetical protein
MPKPARGERTKKNKDKKAKKMAGAGAFYGSTKNTKGKKSTPTKTKSG